MRISKYGVTLVRLTQDDLELVRLWRNDDEIKKYMNFQEYITPEMQQKWFESINNPENFYYIIEYKGDKIGLVNDKNIDWEKKTAEGGMFIWDKRYINSIVPLKVSILILEIAYLLLGWNKTYIKVRKDNQRAIDYNKALGYEISGESENQICLFMELDKEHFNEKAGKLRKWVNPNTENEKITITFEAVDELNGAREAIEHVIKRTFPDEDAPKFEILYS